MRRLGSSPARPPATLSPRTTFAQDDMPGQAAWWPDIAPGGDAIKPGAIEPFGRAARLAEMALGISPGSLTVAGSRSASGMRHRGLPDAADRQSAVEQSLFRSVTESGKRVVIDDILLSPRTSTGGPLGSAGFRAWAGFPVRDPDGRVVGALCVADRAPRRWSAGDVAFLDILADVAAGEVALQVALQHGAERAELARTLQESLLPPRLPEIPGLRVAARYVAGGTGAEVLGDFYDVFPSVRTSWGLAVGDVCGKGVPAA